MEEFDPDAYLEAEANFNPDDYLDSPPVEAEPVPPPQPRDPGRLRAAGSQFLSGVFKGGSDEAAGALGAALTDVMPGAALRLPDETMRQIGSTGDLYRGGRDVERQTLEAAQREYPWLSTAANIAGDVSSEAVLQALGVPVASQGYQVGMGALSGLLGSDEELTGPQATPESARGAATSALVGGGLGYGLPIVGRQVARYAPGALARLRNVLEEKAIEQGRRVLENVSGTLARNRKPTSDAAVRQALQDRAIAVFGTTQGAFDRLRDLAEQRGAAYGSILEDLQRSGVTGPDAEALARQLDDRAAAARRVAGANQSVPNYYEASAEAVRAQPDPGFVMGGGQATGPRQSRLALDQAEVTKRNLQKEAKLDRINKTGLDEAKEDVARLYKEAIEDTVAEAGRAAPPGSEVAELASEFEPMKRLLGRTIEAREAARMGAAAGQRRSAVGLADRLAGNTAAAANMGPGGVLAATLGNMLARNRGTSAAARGLYGGSRLANTVSRMVINNPRAAQALGAVLGGTVGRVVGVDPVQQALIEALRSRQQPREER